MSEEILARLEELERRLASLEDVKSIQELQHRYIRCLADRDWQGCLDCYSDDAVCDLRAHGILRGRAQIADLILGELPNVVRTHDAYVLSSPEIEVDGDHARGTWTWHRHQCEFRTSFGLQRVWGPWSEGRYRCEYVRERGEWRMSHVWFRVVSPDTDEQLAALAPDSVIGRPRA